MSCQTKTYLHTLVLVMSFLHTGTSHEQTIDHTHSLPIEIFSSCNKVVLVSPLDKDICCGQELTFKNKLATIDLQLCNKFITCSKSPNFQKEIIQSTCKTGMIATGGCLRSTMNRTKCSNDVTVRCLCTEKGLQCPDQLWATDRCKLTLAAISHEDTITYFDKTDDFKGEDMLTIMLEEKELCLEREATEKSKIESIGIENNRLVVKLSNALNVFCKVNSVASSCKFTCNSAECSHGCALKEFDDDKVKVTVTCGDNTKDMWLFRKFKGTHEIHTITAHSGWRSHNSVLCTLLIINLCIGYVIIRIICGLCLFCWECLLSLHGVVNSSYYKYIVGSKVPLFSNCKTCHIYPETVYDALLHDEHCVEGVCVYCGNFEIENEHMKKCSQREKKINKFKIEKKQEIKDAVKQLSTELKRTIWENNLTRKRIPMKIWTAVTGILILFVIISPSDSLLVKPCNRLVGHTSKCSSKSAIDVLGGEADEHHHWSQIELGMLTRLESDLVHDKFSANAIHRLKTEDKHLVGNSEETLEIEGIKCKSDGVCKSVTELKWAGEAYKGNIQSYKTNEKGYHTTSMHIALVDVEVVYPMDLLYRTTQWRLDSKSYFSCTNTNCEEVCKTPETNKCLLKKNMRPKDTSWAHNPSWCLSMYSGCSCNEIFVKPEFDKSIYEIYRLGEPEMRGMLCIEQNSIYIDCEIIDRAGNYEFGKIKVQVTKWLPKISVDRKIIVEKEHGSNNSRGIALTGPVCDKENCNPGDAGDYQFSKLWSDCSDGVYFKYAGIDSKLLYSFAMTPEWEVTHPKPGAKRFEKYRRLTTHFTEHTVNLEKNQLTIGDGNFGSFALEASVNDLEIYEILDESKIKDFSVTHCTGEFLSFRGGICVFKITLEEAEKTTIKISSNDDNTMVQDDQQVIVLGLNIFRKHMFVRSEQSFYYFCAHHKSVKLCNSIKGNFSKPKLDFSISPYNTFVGETKSFMSKCDSWFGIVCMFNRIIDFWKSLWSCFVWALIGIGLSIAFIILYNKYSRNHEMLPLVAEQRDSNKAQILKTVLKGRTKLM
uniref:Glycoprotein n=1 Tax=Promirotermes bunya-like virus 1 TaxID=3133473 RepID=A0AAT9JH14_9VIRU